MIVSMIPSISLPFSNFLLLVFWISCVVTIIFSAILIYHWRAYGESTALTNATTVVYLLGSALLLGSMLSAVALTF